MLPLPSEAPPAIVGSWDSTRPPVSPLLAGLEPRPLPVAAPAAELILRPAQRRSFFPLLACSHNLLQGPGFPQGSCPAPAPRRHVWPAVGEPCAQLPHPSQRTQCLTPGMCGEDALAEGGGRGLGTAAATDAIVPAGGQRPGTSCDGSQIPQRPWCRLEPPSTGVGSSSGGAAVCPAGNLLRASRLSFFSFHSLHTPWGNRTPHLRSFALPFRETPPISPLLPESLLGWFLPAPQLAFIAFFLASITLCPSVAAQNHRKSSGLKPSFNSSQVKNSKGPGWALSLGLCHVDR